jgi:predicted nucleic acid-binding protein
VARLLDLTAAIEASRGIIFDTSTLFEIYDYATRHGVADARLLRIRPGLRYTTVVSLYEFLCGRGDEERARRVDWLQENGIKTVQLTRGTSQTFHNLGRLVKECGHVADLLIGATATAANFAVASRDRDFDRMDQVIRVTEFVP